MYPQGVMGEEFRKRVAGRVRQLRQWKEWTPAELSKRLGWTAATVSKLERGKDDARAPRLDTLAVLADVFGVTLADFLWPVISPADAEAAEQIAKAQFDRQVHERLEVLRQEFLKALDDVETAYRLLTDLSMIVQFGTPDQVGMVSAVVAAMRAYVVAPGGAKEGTGGEAE